MYRVASLFALLLLLTPTFGCGAQEADGPTHLYEAFFKVNYADLPEWNRQYFQYSVPVLDDLVSRGVIEGYNQWEHNTGGEYNVRMAIRTNDWNSIDSFWSQYFEGLQASTPEAESQASAGMIQAHHDEIWNFGTINVPEGLETAYMYAATYQYNFQDESEWIRIHDEVAGPLFNQAMADGILGGWVTLGHNTGGRHNYKLLFFFEDWDHIDDFTGQVLGTMAEQTPADFEKYMSMIQGHNDVIYVPTTNSGS